MKKISFFAAFMCFILLSYGQVFVSQDFSGGQMPPANWTIDGFATQWSVSSSANAAGIAPEAMFTYTNQTGTSRLISPAQDLTGLSTIKLSFKHFYDYYASGPKIGVATRSGGGAWNTVWEVTPNANVGPQQKDFDISNGDVGKPDFQFCVYITGYLYNVDYWYIDNVLLFNPLNLDAELTTITSPVYYSDFTPVTGIISNFGLSNINSCEIEWTLDNATVYSSAFSGLNIPLFGTYNFTSTDLFNGAIGSHDLKVWIKNVNGVSDDDQSNDTLNKIVNRVCHTVEHLQCVEEFTSSTCAPCAQFNTSFVPWCTQHDETIALVKYQMNWPGAGDPYYTAEGGIRRNYYGVTWVPWLVMDGVFVNTSMTDVNLSYQANLAKPGLMDIAASHTINGTSISVNTTILPFANFTNLKISVVVFEFKTTGNHSSNGETEFHHVMMKMMPDANGTTVNLTDREPYTLSLTQDLSGTNVEEYTDLGVIIIVQGSASKDVFQAAYSVENGSYNTVNTLQDIQLDGVSLAGFDPAVLNYQVVLNEFPVLPVVTGIPAENDETVIVIPTETFPGITTIDVFAEDLTSHNLYTIEFLSDVGQNEINANPLSVFPNPTSGQIFIQGAANSKIVVTNAAGKELMNIVDFQGNLISLQDFPDGVYILNIIKDNQNTIRKKIVLTK